MALVSRKPVLRPLPFCQSAFLHAWNRSLGESSRDEDNEEEVTMNLSTVNSLFAGKAENKDAAQKGFAGTNQGELRCLLLANAQLALVKALGLRKE